VIGATPAALVAPVPAADRTAAARGAAYLARLAPADAGGAEADAVVALRAAGRPGGAHLARLRVLTRSYARGPGAAAKVALAAVAAGANPRCFGGVDLVARIRAGYADGAYGASIWDDALSVMALAGAGEPVPRAATRLLVRLRGQGGWGFSLGGGTPDDADSTGLALMALRAAGRPARDPAVRAGSSWLQHRQLPGAGWSGAAGGSTDSNSTGLALLGLRAANRPAPATATAALRSLQGQDGSFAATATAPGSRLLATVQAVPSLLGRTLPPARRLRAARSCTLGRSPQMRL
jgi:hypothetical protein